MLARLASHFHSSSSVPTAIMTRKAVRCFSESIPIVAKTIREDGDIQFIDVDVYPDRTLLTSLKNATPIHYGCGGKGVCGQCQIALPQDIYNRIPKPTQDELDTLATSLDPPKFGRLACRVKPTPIFKGRTIDVYIPFEWLVCLHRKQQTI